MLTSSLDPLEPGMRNVLEYLHPFSYSPAVDSILYVRRIRWNHLLETGLCPAVIAPLSNKNIEDCKNGLKAAPS